jgi:glyceraldehyde 3-phosphate dehydrogenase
MPELEGRLDGSAIRVPTPNVSCIDLNFIPMRNTTVAEINSAVKKAAEGELKGILEYGDEPTVSIDYNHDSHSCNFASLQTTVMGGNLVRVLGWYDNEWGFSCRMADTAVEMGKYL